MCHCDVSLWHVHAIVFVLMYTMLLYIVRFSDANCRKSIVGLIKRIGEAYGADKQQDHFVKDLMSFSITDLLQLSTNDDEVKNLFIEMIRTFIKRKALQEVILEQVLSFVVS